MRGRPRQNRERKDKGTEELQQKRKRLLKGGLVEDPSFAESVLGVLYAHDVISKPLYEVGRFFGELGYRYVACLGHTFRARASVITLNRGGTLGGGQSALSDWLDEKQTKAWLRALKALEQAGPRPYKVVLKIVFYDQDLYSNPFPRSLLKEAGPLRQGLERLETYFKEGLKDKKGMLCDPALNLLRSTTSQQLLKECQHLAPPLRHGKANLFP
jgi:hypothetical protein